MNAPNRLTTSSRRFDTSSQPQAVGLGIVAAMSISNSTTTTTTDRVPAAKVLLSGAITTTKPMLIGGRTKSIPIQFSGERRFVSGCGGGFEEEVVMEMEMDMEQESYTCVTAKIGNDRVRKREYFDDPVVPRGVFSRSSVVDVVENEETSFWGRVDFLSSCFLCRKDLYGIDIFMYRGEKAFCSVECRDVQIATDKLKEKRGRIRVRSMERSESPCCSPMLSYTGVVAA